MADNSSFGRHAALADKLHGSPLPRRARAIRAQVDPPRQPLTVADAAAKTRVCPSATPRAGLKWLSTEFRGQLSGHRRGPAGPPLSAGGFTKPWRSERTRAVRMRPQRVRPGSHGRAAAFVVRAWVAIVHKSPGYAAIFVALILAMTASPGSNMTRRRAWRRPRSGGALAYAFPPSASSATRSSGTSPPVVALLGLLALSGGWGGGYDARRYAPRQARRAASVRNALRAAQGASLLLRPRDSPGGPPRGRTARSGGHPCRQGPHRPGRRHAGDRAAARAGRPDDGSADARLRGRRRRQRGRVGSSTRFPAHRRKTAASRSETSASFRASRRPPGARPAEAAAAADGQLGGHERRHRGAQRLQLAHGRLGDRERIDPSSACLTCSIASRRTMLDTGTPIALGVVPILFSTALLFVVPTIRASARPAAGSSARQVGRARAARRASRRPRARAVEAARDRSRRGRALATAASR